MAWGRCGTESDSLQLLSPLQSKKPCSIEQGFLGCNSLTITYFHTGTRTIIGVESFHGPVRDGKGWDRLAMVIRHDLLPHSVGPGPGAAQPIWEEECWVATHRATHDDRTRCWGAHKHT